MRDSSCFGCIGLINLHPLVTTNLNPHPRSLHTPIRRGKFISKTVNRFPLAYERSFHSATAPPTMSTKGRRRSSLIRYKEKGGCTVQQLAGTSGLDYHGPCKSIKTPGNFHFNVFKLIGKICGKTDYLLCVKASIIFVYDSKNLNSPMYR